MAHGGGLLRVINFRTCVRRKPLPSTCVSHECCVKPFASTFRAFTTARPRQRPSQTRAILIASTICLGAGLGYLYITDTRASLHWWLVVPLIRAVWPDAEDAHENGVKILKELYRFGLHPRERGQLDDAGDLETEVFGYTLVNPLGISSGLDKHGEIPTQLLALGPAIVEVGGITPINQSGNPKPRVFRIVSHKAMINRYGLNSHGATLIAARLRQRVREFAYRQGYGLDEDAEQFVLDGGAGVPPGSLVKGKLLSVQVAKNQSTPLGDIEAIRRDFVNATSLLAKYADVIVVNVSCPNEPGYRNLQQIEPLTKILTGVVAAAASVDRKVKVRTMVKVSSDEVTEEQIASICTAVWKSGVDGVVVGNTTTSRPDWTSLSSTEAAVMEEGGGYSGPQLFHRTVSLVKRYRRILDCPLHASKQTQLRPNEATGTGIEASVKSAEQNLKEASNESTSQPSLRIPERRPSPTTGGIGLDVASAPTFIPSPNLEQSSTSKVRAQPATLTPKTIFCTGGITNGQQALEVLNAGASVAQIYTALVYGGVGKITSMKQEMRHESREPFKSKTEEGSR